MRTKKAKNEIIPYYDCLIQVRVEKSVCNHLKKWAKEENLAGVSALLRQIIARELKTRTKK